MFYYMHSELLVSGSSTITTLATRLWQLAIFCTTRFIGAEMQQQVDGAAVKAQ